LLNKLLKWLKTQDHWLPKPFRRFKHMEISSLTFKTIQTVMAESKIELKTLSEVVPGK
jgi:hypothetical protein